MKTSLKILACVMLLSGILAFHDVQGTLADLSAFTDSNVGDPAIIEGIKAALVDQAVGIKNQVSYDGSITVNGGQKKVKFFRIGSAVHFYVYGSDNGKDDLAARVYMQLPDTDNLYFVPKKCELIKNLNKEPPALKKCESAKLVADNINKMLTESATRGGKSFDEAQQMATDITECIKRNVPITEIGLQCLEEGVKMDPDWYRQQLTEQAEILRAQGKQVTISGNKLIISG